MCVKSSYCSLSPSSFPPCLCVKMGHMPHPLHPPPKNFLLEKWIVDALIPPWSAQPTHSAWTMFQLFLIVLHSEFSPFPMNDWCTLFLEPSSQEVTKPWRGMTECTQPVPPLGATHHSHQMTHEFNVVFLDHLFFTHILCVKKQQLFTAQS